MLSLFFGFISPNKIEAWEALILLFMYFGYVCTHVERDAFCQSWRAPLPPFFTLALLSRGVI
jgi:hypothetical protein